MALTDSPNPVNPVEVDTELADLYRQVHALRSRLDSREEYLKHAAGAKYEYVGRRRVTSMTVAEARSIVEAALESGVRLLHGCTLQYFGQPTVIEQHDALLAEIAAVHHAITVADSAYTGWSRFFLVTSSKGHIHSSMHCSTCRPSTTFGWLPGLSGRSEADAVAECGPALCSVCFPTAPVEWTAAEITKAQAEARTA